ncbi:MAG: dihydrolipoamide acetyltransferase family protein [Gemmatimonadota bacterium]|nr:dihydrolipoamide acetyltransferase family protein [Gemmatimonadota bacterium]
MATRVHMEALSPTMEEGQIVKWLKGEGEEVSQGDILAEIETDKATMELVARGEGVLRRVFVAEGAAAPVGDVIAVIAAEGEDIAALEKGLGGGGGPAGPEADVPPPGASASPGGPAPARPPRSEAPARIRASPVARRLARDAGLDLADLRGSGPGGRVVKRDVEAAAAAAAAWPTVPGTEFEDVPLSPMRATVARRLAESLGPVPHFFLTVDVDMTRALAARARINELLAARGTKASINDLVVKAVAVALTHHPECNAQWRGDSIRRFDRCHIGVAVAVPDGLVAPVVRDAQAKGLGEIGAEIRELAGRAREKRLQPHEYTGSTFSVSNLGMLGIEAFTAVINPPEAGILAVGAVEERPVAVGGEVVVRPRMRVTMSCDHRVIDGAQGARFLATLKAFLEEPAAILA